MRTMKLPAASILLATGLAAAAPAHEKSAFEVWLVDPANWPTPQLLFDDPSPERDAHGVPATKHERFVWVGDRDANVAEVFDGRTGAYIATVDLVSDFSADPIRGLVRITNRDADGVERADAHGARVRSTSND